MCGNIDTRKETESTPLLAHLGQEWPVQRLASLRMQLWDHMTLARPCDLTGLHGPARHIPIFTLTALTTAVFAESSVSGVRASKCHWRSQVGGMGDRMRRMGEGFPRGRGRREESSQNPPHIHLLYGHSSPARTSLRPLVLSLVYVDVEIPEIIRDTSMPALLLPNQFWQGIYWCARQSIHQQVRQTLFSIHHQAHIINTRDLWVGDCPVG